MVPQANLITGFHHITVYARQQKRSLAFYLDKLGFQQQRATHSPDDTATVQHDLELPGDNTVLSIQYYPKCHRAEPGGGICTSLILAGEGKPGLTKDPDGLNIEVRSETGPLRFWGVKLSCVEPATEKDFWCQTLGALPLDNEPHKLQLGKHVLELETVARDGSLGFGAVHHIGLDTEHPIEISGMSPEIQRAYGASSYLYAPSELLLEFVSRV